MFAGHSHPDSNALGCNRKYWSHSGGWISQGMNMGDGISWMDGCMGESNMEYLTNSDIDTRWAVCENFLFSEDFVQRIYEVKTLRQGRVEMWSEDRQDNGETGSRFLTSQWENATSSGRQCFLFCYMITPHSWLHICLFENKVKKIVSWIAMVLCWVQKLSPWVWIGVFLSGGTAQSRPCVHSPFVHSCRLDSPIWLVKWEKKDGPRPQPSSPRSDCPHAGQLQPVQGVL